MTEDERAKRVAAFMWERDKLSPGMGMKLAKIEPGSAVVTMRIRPDMVNGHGICHGGVIFTLADSTFAYACNSRNQSTLAQMCSITYVSPGHEGEELRAEAREINLAGRSGIYDVTISGEDGRKVAEFRGHSRQISGQHIEE